jgi:hypothetical protein
MFSKLQKGMLVLAAAAGATLFAVGAGSADEPPTKFKVNPGAISAFEPSGRAARSPADLEAKVFVMNEQNLAPWIVKGIVKNVGGHEWRGPRLVTLYEVTGSYGPGGRRPKSVILATKTLPSVRAGQSVSLEKVFSTPPSRGTRFVLVISPGDSNPDNDRAQVKFLGT